ncbi:LAGLIDADG family homing endonuclease [Bacillus sp. ISL-41]|uniref:LAGLIDADG family homing endonuclease n=1 Tax=Bacillus sp. ISL-41 TaxID=2819127 RepID=UPI001BEA6BCC|nr:LAGLIDADG family homing endonuclease [Bacillus sp. ISL-41]MBT2643431.1 LAGLIDADG family homing endonuclease [Bacillus sp. ISL-41]
MEIWEASYIAGVIDGEGSITLTRMHENEHRRPVLTIASTDKELLIYIQSLTGGIITNKRNYKPGTHKDSFTLSIKSKFEVLATLQRIHPYLRIERKRRRALWILERYDLVTPRNGKYRPEMLKAKIEFEDFFFKI